jgi:F-type H+-transporting ATPase subunit b
MVGLPRVFFHPEKADEGVGRRPGGLPHFLLRFFAILAISVAPVFAQESGGPAKPDMTLWEWLNFAILAAILGWIVFKQGAPALRSRSQQIQEGLEAGHKAKADADARAAAVDARLTGLEREIAAMRTNAAAEREREAERIHLDSQNEIARIQKQCRLELESLGKLARLEVQRAAAKLAMELAEQKVRARMSPELQSKLVEGFLEDLPDGRTNTRSNAG